MGFQPVIGHIYYLYERAEEKWVLSMVAPENWGKKIPFQKFVSKVKLLADHTWEILE
jgi:hypothetical protein